MAAFAAINKAVAATVAAQVFEAKKQVIDQLIAFMADKIDMDEDMMGFFEEFKATIVLEKVEVPKTKAAKGKNADGSEKKKREPSAYNLWIKEKMAEIKGEKPELKGKDLMAAAIAEWKKLDVKPTKGKKVVEETKVSDADSEEETSKPKKGRAAKKPAATKGKKGKKAVSSDSESDSE